MSSIASPELLLTGEHNQSLGVLREYAEFWKIPYSLEQTGQDPVVFASGDLPDDTERIRACIVCPSGPENGRSIAKKLGLGLSLKAGLLRIPVSKGIFASINTIIYEFQGPNVETLISGSGKSVLQRVKGTQIHLMCVGLVTDYVKQLYGGLHDPPSAKFRFITRMPFSYSAIPVSFRSRLFRSTTGPFEVGEEKLGAIEFLRAAFLASVSVVAHSPIPRIGFWKQGVSSTVAVSHDVETSQGLRSGARRLLEVETKLGIRSTWNIPSSRYPISRDDLNAIAKWGELGAHDTKHDGRLVLADSDGMLERLRACKKDLELHTGAAVIGFRSPLLQHSRDLITLTHKAGFRFDSSVPSWERLSPTSLRPHGVGTVFPFWVDGCLELPVSLPQDHQLIRVVGMTPSDAADSLIQISKWISGIGGASVLLVHPDYEFAFPENLPEYERLLHGILQLGSTVMTLGEMAEWWRFRSSAGWKAADGRAELRQGNAPDPSSHLEVQLVRSYGGDGFEVEILN